jgi:hypothetical protein
MKGPHSDSLDRGTPDRGSLGGEDRIKVSRVVYAYDGRITGVLHFANKFGLLQGEEEAVNALSVWLEQRAHFAELIVNSDTPSSNGRRAEALNSLNQRFPRSEVS